MGKHNLSGVLKSMQHALHDNAPKILTGLGITGMITATVLAVKATPKAMRLIDQRKKELEVEDLTPKETVKTAWKCYIPATVTGTVSTACLIGASSVSSRRSAVLAAACKLSETAFAEYREKTLATIGEKKEQVIREAVNKKHIEENPVSKNEVIITEKGDTLCYDHASGRYFKSDIDKIKKTVNELNRRMLHENYISLNDLYIELGLAPTSLGEDLGWNIGKGMIDIYFGSQLSDDGRPCIVLDYSTPPTYDFDR